MMDRHARPRAQDWRVIIGRYVYAEIPARSARVGVDVQPRETIDPESRVVTTGGIPPALIKMVAVAIDHVRGTVVLTFSEVRVGPGILTDSNGCKSVLEKALIK